MAGFEKNGGGAAVVEGGGFLLNNHPDIFCFRPKCAILWTKKHERLDEKGNAK